MTQQRSLLHYWYEIACHQRRIPKYSPSILMKMQGHMNRRCGLKGQFAADEQVRGFEK